MITALRERLPLLARVVAWLVVLLYLAGMLTTFWLERRLGLRDENPMEDVVLWVGFGAFAVVDALLVARRPANLIGWLDRLSGELVSVVRETMQPEHVSVWLRTPEKDK